MLFLSTLSLRRATQIKQTCRAETSISIHALLAESDERADSLAHAPPEISIHALLAESDISARRGARESIDFYPRSPCGERQIPLRCFLTIKTFLSTLSLRRATLQHLTCGANSCISIHALLAESDLANMRNSPNNQISIHALLAESDWDWFFTGTLDPKFLSTLSLRRATLGLVFYWYS